MIDMSPAAVEARLRRASELSALHPPQRDYVDMSREAVTARLKECAEISKLAWQLELAGRQLR